MKIMEMQPWQQQVELPWSAKITGLNVNALILTKSKKCFLLDNTTGSFLT